MGERKPPLKADEQYPLLKVDGAGDIHVTPAHSTPASGWGVTCKRTTRFTRWPEFISACWMTLILCGISFLVFHALGMGFHKRQQYIIMKCDNEKPASNVYYHEIVRNPVPFALYTEYLSNIAMNYPLLQFKVIFLVDDCYPDLSCIIKRRYPPVHLHPWMHTYRLNDDSAKLDDGAKPEDVFTDFNQKYPNVNVTIESLNKFMENTPLKHKWRLIPQTHLKFVARVTTVWQNGGIGMDLKTFNDDYHNGLFTDARIDAVLKQHNDGINPTTYKKALNKIDHDEATAIFNMFTGIINHFLNETRTFFTNTVPVPLTTDKTPLVRTHRNKRAIYNHSDIATAAETSNDPKDFYNVDNTSNTTPKEFKKDTNHSVDATTTATYTLEKSNATDFKTSSVKGNESESHQVVLFYDFSLMADGLAGRFPHMNKHKATAAPKASNISPHLLSLNRDGTFVAASSKIHPFLSRLIGYLGMHPQNAIQNAFLSQCSGVFKDDLYCNNIYIL